MDLVSLNKTCLDTLYLYQSFRIDDNSSLERHICKCLRGIYYLVLALVKHEHIFQHIVVNLYQYILLRGIQSLIGEQLLQQHL